MQNDKILTISAFLTQYSGNSDGKIMEEIMPYKISKSDVSVEGKTAIISGEGGRQLAKSLIQKNGLTLAELSSTFGFVHPTEISLGSDGSVHIENESIIKSVNSLSAASSGGDFFDTNCQCTKEK